MTLSGSSYEDNVKIAKAEIVANQWQELGVKEKNSMSYDESDTSFAVITTPEQQITEDTSC